MEVVAALRAIRSGWLIVAILSAILAGLASVLTALTTPTYTATTQGLVSVGNAQSRPTYSLTNGSQYIVTRMTSYSQLGVTTPVLEPVVEQFRLPLTAAALREHVVSENIVNNALLEVKVEYDDPVLAARIADATLAQLAKTVENLEHGNVTVTAVGPALVPTAPGNRNIAVNTAVGAAAGLILGSFIAVAAARIRSRRATRWAAARVTSDT
ncbi:YveK family protein [Mycobacterium sp. E740]|uniref:YveK family protein n=1 Tax=Mycobacterium sp. E740 TaxID=1834149 RepID=UPI0008021895|nr:hypothetical protein [Mycobacterium sp. E740]OBI74857.1 hypothetical protein A5663_00435 [Mycobacterium sp. E740]